MNNNKYSIILIILFSLSIIFGFIILARRITPAQSPTSKLLEFSEILTKSQTLIPRDTIAVLDIFEPIYYENERDYLGIKTSGVIDWIKRLKSIEDNPNVKAILIRVNSPGGSVSATQELYNKLKKIKEKNKKIVVSIGDIGASGAYYIACAADYIIANPGSLVGSIGVIIAGLEVEDLLKKWGINYNVIKSGKNKDILSSYRKMTEEERTLLSNIVMDVYKDFFNAVKDGRNIEPEKLRNIADGRVFTGNQALKNKLIDELGDFEYAIEVTAKLAEIKGKPNIYELKQPASSLLKFISSFYGNFNDPSKLFNYNKNLLKFRNYSVPVQYLYTF